MSNDTFARDTMAGNCNKSIYVCKESPSIYAKEVPVLMHGKGVRISRKWCLRHNSRASPGVALISFPRFRFRSALMALYLDQGQLRAVPLAAVGMTAVKDDQG